MGLNPRGIARKQLLDDHFNGGSPYFSMFRCGYYGVPLEDCIAKCKMNGIVIREKDIQSWKDGSFKRGVCNQINVDPKSISLSDVQPGIRVEDMKLSDFPLLPVGWHGSKRRFFPCTKDNKPMQKWGWTREFTPELYTQADAKALSPCGWVGQNMLYQPFVVMDIDGRGHGEDDVKVIEFGNQFRNTTFTMEDPAKPGSFHLYFKTNRLIPVKHFPWAKLDFMGNAVNAAVYMKNKKPNNLPLRQFDEEVWQLMLSYQAKRKEM